MCRAWRQLAHQLNRWKNFLAIKKIIDIYEGMQQIQQLIIARQVLGKRSKELK
jgi:alkylation response protein AidB-like acyl-CoA dehydrogenase